MAARPKPGILIYQKSRTHTDVPSPLLSWKTKKGFSKEDAAFLSEPAPTNATGSQYLTGIQS